MLHTQPDIADVFDETAGQVALYDGIFPYQIYLPSISNNLNVNATYLSPRKSTSEIVVLGNTPARIVDFVSWGSAPGAGAAPAVKVGIWFEDTSVAKPRYLDVSIVPDGLYYWRVQVIYSNGLSVWSSPVSIEVVTLPQVQALSLDSDSPMATNTSKVLGITWQLQHKDSLLLDLEGSPEIGQGRWDSAHETDGDGIVGNNDPVLVNNLDGWYCVRASTAMIASYYGGNLSQDRISYEFFKDRSAGPDTDLGHGTGPNEQAIINWLDWALGDPHMVNPIHRLSLMMAVMWHLTLLPTT